MQPEGFTELRSIVNNWVYTTEVVLQLWSKGQTN
jgi:hypothetical protein